MYISDPSSLLSAFRLRSGLPDPNGDNEDRTRDLLLARQALSQLSYTPIGSGTHLLSHAVPSVVSSAVRGLTIVFGMGTGVSPGRIGTRNLYSNVLQLRKLRFRNFVPSSCHSQNGLRIRPAFLNASIHSAVPSALPLCSLVHGHS